MNVLMTAASRRVALPQAFQAALRPYGGRLVVTDVDPSSPAVHVAGRAYRVPYSGDPQYILELLSICSTEHISLVVPTIDDELESLAAARSRFELAGAKVACSPPGTGALCNDKYRTCTHLRSQGIDAALSWLPAELPADAPEVLLLALARGDVLEPSIGCFRTDLWMTNYETSIFLPASRLTLPTLATAPRAFSGAA